MPVITYIEADGSQYEADVPVGDSVMQGAVDNMVDGIVAECGGACACSTCHCYVDEAWWEKVGSPEDSEQCVLEAVSEPQPTSRLSCQITVTEALDGLVVRLPESQF